MKTILCTLLLFISTTVFTQDKTYTEEEISITDLIDGSLVIPENSSKPNLAIIIAGSGPTNRNGNQNFLKSNNLKKLANQLANNNIASFRYDKRIVKQIKRGKVNVKDMRFEDFVNDAKSIINYFKEKNQFSKIYLIGHSQGSLVGMLAAEENIDGFISLAGAGQNIGDVIVDQINNTARQFAEDTKRVVKTLKSGKTTTDFPPALGAMFNMETQPFMMSWMAYNPTEIIANLNIPILVINGTKDLQVSVEEAKLLANANKKAELKIIENMNHVLFTIEGDKLENSKSYNESFREINPELINEIVNFIKQ
ncbi:alpha/beta hydrolase [Winogradskyella haliclonae]|uniref:Alpha/beta hydrolase n=1 Tax=Winogradskyella haliclonae TaxID=2048558 RepID=A0ABQ2BYT4_9FLAO|nr:alpha/beta fold hydrolase [Winogradskyella haliclonae]GGI57080.1 alpha/beta hydrolase [Winogradskyella haliclonae]